MSSTTSFHKLPRVLIVLVNWMRSEDSLACIQALIKQDHRDFDIVLVDNQSPDGSFERIREALLVQEGITPMQDRGEHCLFSLPTDGKILLVRAPSNLGFAGGNNFGVKAAAQHWNSGHAYVWFLNNDTEPSPDCLGLMLAKFSGAEDVGMVGSTQIYFFDKKTVQVFGGSIYKPFSGLMREIGNGEQWPVVVSESLIEREMDYVCGASMLVHAALIDDIGLMREDYFIFFEEIDWCERARKAGYRMAYASRAVVFHKEGASIGTGSGAKRSLLAEYYGMRNKLLVTWRFFPWAFPSVWLISWLQVLRRLAQRRPRNALLMAKVLIGAGSRPA